MCFRKLLVITVHAVIAFLAFAPFLLSQTGWRVALDRARSRAFQSAEEGPGLLRIAFD